MKTSHFMLFLFLLLFILFYFFKKWIKTKTKKKKKEKKNIIYFGILKTKSLAILVWRRKIEDKKRSSWIWAKKCFWFRQPHYNTQLCIFGNVLDQAILLSIVKKCWGGARKNRIQKGNCTRVSQFGRRIAHPNNSDSSQIVIPNCGNLDLKRPPLVQLLEN